MSTEIETVLKELTRMEIPYEITRHPAVFTIEELDRLELPEGGEVCKNLFLRDAKGRRHSLIVLQKDKKADLRDLQKQIGSTPLGFASQERLWNCLKLSPGSVSPLGILNDENREVAVFFDKDLTFAQRLGVHPNDNRATLWLTFSDLEKVITCHGNPLHFITV